MFKLIEQGYVPLETLGSLLEEKLSVALWTWDLESQVVKWSRGLYHLFGIRPDGIPSYTLMEQAVHIDDRKPQNEIERALRESVTVERELRVVMPDRRMRWIKCQISPIVDNSGTPTMAIGVCTDITPYRDMVHFSRLTASRFAALCKVSSSLYWTATPDGRYAELLNTSGPNRYQGTDLRALMQPGYESTFDKTISASFPLRMPFHLVIPFRADDGSYRRHWSRVMPIVSEKGDVQEWLGVSQDPIAIREIWASQNNPSQLTGAQMRAARAILRWSVADLVGVSGVSPTVIRRLEESDHAIPVEIAHDAIERAFTQAGVEFVHDIDGKPGVRPR